MRLRKSSTGFATAGLICMVVGAMTLTLFGVGVVSRALDVYDGNVWLWSSANGSTQRANLDSGKVDMRFGLKDAKNHDIDVVQTDSHLLLHDRISGVITSVDLADLSSGASVTVPPGKSSTVAMWNNTVLLVNPTQGKIRRLDPGSLKAIGKPLTLEPNIIAGTFDSDGRYWVVSPATGKATPIIGTPLSVSPSTEVAKPDHRLKLTVLDHGAAVVDETAEQITTVDRGKPHTIRVPGLTSTAIAPRTTSSIIAITKPEARQVVLIDGDKVSTLNVPGMGPLGEATVFAGRVYVSDNNGQQVIGLSTAGTVTDQINTSGGNGPVTLEQREGALVINEPAGASSYVVDRNHAVKHIVKYTDAAAGPDKDAMASNGAKKLAPNPTSPVPHSKPGGSPKSPGLPSQPASGNQGPGKSTGAAPRQDLGPNTQNQPVRAPGAPELDNARAGDGRITLDYYAPNDTGGAKLTAIDIYCNDIRVIHDANPGNGKRNASFQAQNGTPCPLRGYAINSAGSSAAGIGGTVTPKANGPATAPQGPQKPSPTTAPTPSPSPTPKPPATNGAVPTGVNATIPSGKNVRVTWNPVNVPAGSKLDRYVIFQCDVNGILCVQLFSTTSTSYTVDETNAGKDGGRFGVASVIDGKQSARSQLSNAVTWN
jgi:hypothetical protein